MAPSPLHATHHDEQHAAAAAAASGYGCSCGRPGCTGCQPATLRYDHTDAVSWFLSGECGEDAPPRHHADHHSASFYGASEAAAPPSHHHLQPASLQQQQQQQQPQYPQLQTAELPQISSLMASDAEPIFFDRMNDMKFTEVKMEPGILTHQPLDLFPHQDIISYHGMTSYYNPLEFGNTQPQLLFDPTPAPSLQAHLNYEQLQTYGIAPSPSCTTTHSVVSSFSMPSVLQQGATTSYSPPPQDPLVPSSSSTLSRSTQKKRIQAVSCHSNSICANCGTRDTSLWRRNNTGEIECNACNLYFRKNGRKRPMSLKKGVIMKRNRKPRTGSESN